MRRALQLLLLTAGLLALVSSLKAPPFMGPAPSANPYALYITAYWRLDETTGNRLDMKGSVTLTNGGTQVGYTAGVVTNAAASFAESIGRSLLNGMVPGTNQGPAVLQLTNSSWTVFAWVWPVDDGMGSAPPYGVWGKWDEAGNTEYCTVIESNSKVRIYSIGNDGFDSPATYYAESAGTVTANGWNFIVGVYDQALQTLKVSLNNSAFDTTTSVPSNWSSWAPLSIGGIDSITYVGLNGHQDETAIFKGYAFTAADVAYWWNGGAGRDPTVPCGFSP